MFKQKLVRVSFLIVLVLVASAGIINFPNKAIAPAPLLAIAQDPPIIDLAKDPALKFQAKAKAQKFAETEGESVWAMGVLVTLKLQSKDSGGAYSIFEDYILPGVGTPAHIHTREEEFWYILEGELTWYVGDEIYQAKQGDFINTSRGTPHHFQNDSDRPARMLLGYSPAGFEQWFLDIGKPAENRTETVTAQSKPTSEEIQKAIEVAKTYGVEFLKE